MYCVFLMFMCILLLTSVINDDTNEMIHQCAKAKTFRSQISKIEKVTIIGKSMEDSGWAMAPSARSLERMPSS